MTSAAYAPALDISDADREAALERVRRFAQLMDTYVQLPGGYQIGVEGILGLVPGVGDFAGAALSCYIPLEAYRLNAPWPVIRKMLVNIIIDTVIGIVPVLGDVLDVAWKSNVRNARLLERYLERA